MDRTVDCSNAADTQSNISKAGFHEKKDSNCWMIALCLFIFWLAQKLIDEPLALLVTLEHLFST